MSRNDTSATPPAQRAGERPVRATVTARRGASAGTARGRKVAATPIPKVPEPMPDRAAKAAPAPGAKAPPPAERTVPRQPRVRQSCRLTTAEYADLTALKKRAAALARPAKRGELLRAGLYALRAMDDAALFALLDRLPSPAASTA